MTGERLQVDCRNTAIRNTVGRASIRVSAMALALSIALGGIAVALPATATAQTAQTQQQFSIPAGSLREALDALASQSGITVLYSSELVAGKTSRGLSGRFTSVNALQRLLQGSGLEAQAAGESTFTLRRSSAPKSESQVPAADTSATNGSSQPDIQDLGKMTVTGTRIRGVKEVVGPIQDITRDDFERTGHSSIEGVLRTLPQNFAAASRGTITVASGGTPGLTGTAALNTEGAAAVDLRGLGAGSTLTLLNGQRRVNAIYGQAVDVSAIPLSMIDRMEVVTGGRSAIYGADAVGGVVNLVTRRDFSGFESQAFYGWGQDGGERLQFNVITGMRTARGGFAFAYDHQRDEELDLLKTDLGFEQLFDGTILRRNEVLPRGRQDSAMVSGRFELNDRIELHADALYTQRTLNSASRSLNPGATAESFADSEGSTKQISVSAGATVDLNAGWGLSLNGNLGRNQTDRRVEFFSDYGDFSFGGDDNNTDTGRLSALSLVLDGPLPSFFGLKPLVAFGAEVRHEDYRYSLISDGVPSTRNGADESRIARAVFAELFVPLLTGVEPARDTLSLSLAARYDDYSDIGSAVSPQLGIIFRPTTSLSFQGTISQAFRAPELFRYQPGTTGYWLTRQADPTLGGELRPVLVRGGNVPRFEPEEAKIWSVGVNYEPSFAPALQFSLNYFDIDYDNRLDYPESSFIAWQTNALRNEAIYSPLVNRNPTAEELAAIVQGSATPPVNVTGTPFNPETQAQDVLTIFPGIAIFDNRMRNLAREKVRGLDMKIDARFDTSAGELNFGLNATYTLDHNRNITASSPASNLLNEVGKPVDLRARLTGGWTNGAIGTYLYVNYVDAYANPFSTPASRMGSWTTVDLTLRADTSVWFPNGPLSNMTLTLSAENLLGKDPPRFLNSSSYVGFRFDAANASALGRYLSVRLTKKWN